MELADAIRLAHHDRDGYPTHALQEPAPSVGEAMVILRKSLRRCGHVWLTGEVALAVLRNHIQSKTKDT